MVLLILFCGWHFWHKPAFNQLFAIVLIMVITPPVSFDYTLIALFLLLGPLLICMSRGEVRHAALFLIPLAILMTPQSYLRVGYISYGGQFKALVEVFLLIVAARIQVPSQLFGDAPEPGTFQRVL